MKTLIAIATLLWLGPGLALAQPLEQNFSFGAPPDVLGNAEPRGARPQPPPEVEPAPARRRSGVSSRYRADRGGRRTARRLR